MTIKQQSILKAFGVWFKNNASVIIAATKTTLNTFVSNVIPYSMLPLGTITKEFPIVF